MERKDNKADPPTDRTPDLDQTDLDQTTDAADPGLSAADRRRRVGSAGGGTYGRDADDQPSPPEPTS